VSNKAVMLRLLASSFLAKCGEALPYSFDFCHRVFSLKLNYPFLLLRSPKPLSLLCRTAVQLQNHDRGLLKEGLGWARGNPFAHPTLDIKSNDSTTAPHLRQVALLILKLFHSRNLWHRFANFPQLQSGTIRAPEHSPPLFLHHTVGSPI
jgi:hypothetical protein